MSLQRLVSWSPARPRVSTGQAMGWSSTFPRGALPADVEECRILIKVGLSGQFELPENTSIVSAVYWLNGEAQCKFSQPLTLEIQHYAKSTQTKMLSFARCSKKSPPYTFKMLEGGEFSNLSAYGCMQFHGFSLITLLKNRLPWWTRIESVKYRARLYYLMRGEDQREIHFLITKDLDSHATVRVLLYLKRPNVPFMLLPILYYTEHSTEICCQRCHNWIRLASWVWIR